MIQTAQSPFSRFFALFTSHSTPKPIPPMQGNNQALQLSRMIKQQKSPNNLVYVCKTDSNGKLSCEWVQACSI